MRLLAALATLLLVVGFAGRASAHAALISVEPYNASVVAAPPKSVELRFNESVTPGAIRLIDAEGRERAEARVTASGETISVAVPPDLPQGTTVVSYRVISQDGHPVAGSVTFSIGMPSAPVYADTATSGTVNGLIWLMRIGLYLGLFVGVGGVFFAAWIGQGPAGGQLIMRSLGIGLACAVASLGLLGIDLLNLPLSALVTSAPWSVAFATSLFPATLFAMAAMLIALVAWRSPSVGAALRRTAVAMICVGSSFALSGHAATASPQWLTRTALFIHGVGLSYWMGALAPLAVMAWLRSEPLLRVLRRFSLLAIPTVALIALSGLALAVVQLETFGALIDTRYGNILVAKLVLVLLLLLFAALNRWVFTPVIAREFHRTRPLQRSIAVEFLLMVAILALVAGWRFTPPPRTIVPETPLALHIHGEKAMFQVLVSPGKAGTDDFVLQLMTGEAAPLAAKEVTLTLSLPARGIEPMERDAELGADGYWHVRKVELPFAGRWRIRIEALVTDFEKVALDDELEVAPR